MKNTLRLVEEVKAGLSEGSIIPYLGPGMLELVPGGSPVPASPEALVERLVKKVSVPPKIRNNLTAAAQFIENFKHRKSLSAALVEAFQAEVPPGALHQYIASLPRKPLLIVDAWYDNAMANAIAFNDESPERPVWGQIQGVSQAEHFGTWVNYFHGNGAPAEELEAEIWETILYKPLGSISPAQNFLVSDSDYVEVLTEIDIQTPIPPLVQQMRAGASFLFMGCRFRNQLERTFARQIMKRSSDTHWAVMPGKLTRNEARFLEEQNIRQIDLSLPEFSNLLTGEPVADRVMVFG